MALFSHSIPKAEIEVSSVAGQNEDTAVALYVGSVFATLYLSVDEARKLAADLTRVTMSPAEYERAMSL